MNPQDSPIEKIDAEQLINEFKVFNSEAFEIYLTGIWKDFASRNDNKEKGINKITFSKYYEVPGIIFDRLFSVFDTSKSESLSLEVFKNGMMTLFTKSYDELVKFIFRFYDFDKDGKISREDIRIVLSYIPLNKSKIHKKNVDFKDQIESQDELHHKLDTIFQSKESFNEEEFIHGIENINSDIFLYILIFLHEKRPFNNQTIKLLENIKKSPSVLNMPKSPVSKMIASPTLNSVFQPSIAINKSPTLNKSPSLNKNEEKGLQRQIEHNSNQADLLSQLTGKGQMKPKPKAAAPKFKPNVIMKKDESQVAPIRKVRAFLQELDKDKATQKKIEGNSFLLQFAKKVEPKKPEVKEELNNSLSSEENENIVTANPVLASEENEKGNYCGYGYKITKDGKLKKRWFRLIFRDLYYYDSPDEKVHKGMHNLSGVFIKEEPETTIEDKKLYTVSLIYPMKERKYYIENPNEYKDWLFNLRKAIGYANLNDIYKIKEEIGKGKFGLVHLGINKLSQEKVAIKIMAKSCMSPSELEQAKNEIEMMKVAIHPNIIRLYDEYENVDFIYIIMEYCAGGDLFSFIEKRSFKISEERASIIMRKICTAIYFLHEFGIIHRDLKPENILMTDESDEADIKVLDFGLGKIIGPNETCTEAFGTLSYVSPEVIQQIPHGKGVDLWAIGVISYLLVSGFLPFDDEHSEKEIARQTIHDAVPYPSSIWKNVSINGKSFIDNLLNKKQELRMTIKQALEHPWLNRSDHLPKDNKNLTGADAFKIYANPEQSKKD